MNIAKGKLALVYFILSSVAWLSAHAEQERINKTVIIDKKVRYQLIEKSSSDSSQTSDLFFRTSIDDGKTYSRLRKWDPMVRLRDHTFDPLLHDEAPQTMGNLHLVQIEIQPLSEFATHIEAAGGKVVGFVPPQTYVVRADAESIEAVDALPFVRWTGPYSARYKTTPALWRLLQNDASTGPVRYVISMFSRNGSDVDSVVGKIHQAGGDVLVRSRVASSFLQAELNKPQLAALLNHDNVQFVEPWTPPESDMDIVREVSGANYLETQVPFYTGQGVTGEILDDAIWDTHQGFTTPQFHGEVDIADAHGTPVYGIVFGTGGANPRARGVLPEGHGIFASWPNVGDRAAHTAELVDPLGNYRAVFQTNSWGSGRTTEYTVVSSEMDQIIFDNDLLVTQSQSNAGNRNSRPQAWAKNIVAVGGVRHRDTADLSDDTWSSSASIGPAPDGRIKPDLAHFYDYVFTTDGWTSTSHSEFGGTSASTPITAGHFGLAFQMWADGIFTGEGLPGMGGDVFAARSHSTTARALLINTARQYSFTGTEHDLTRVHQGWGLADVRALYDAAERNAWQLPLVIDETHPLVDQQSRQYVVHVAEGETLPWFKTTMVYMDPPGNPAAAIATINDLSLRMISPSGTVFWGNAGLLEGNWSVSGGTPSTVDTVENIFVEQAESGDWTVEVIAERLVADARLETTQTDADYALVVTCGGENRCSLQSENISPDVAIVSPTAGATFSIGDEVAITAEANDVDGTVTSVEFFVNDISIGIDAEAPYTAIWNTLATGTFTLTARATDDDGATARSSGIAVWVNSLVACEYTIRDEWNTGFIAIVRITNNSAETINGWNVQWEYPNDFYLDNVWNAELTGANPYTASSLSYNGSIASGQFVEFGLQGGKSVPDMPAPIPELGGICGQ